MVLMIYYSFLDTARSRGFEPVILHLLTRSSGLTKSGHIHLAATSVGHYDSPQLNQKVLNE